MANLEEEIQASVDKATAASNLLHQIVNSDENTSITTEGGDVPSVAKKLKEIEATITTGIGVTVAQAEAARDATDVIKSETLVIKDNAVSAQSAAENAQSLAEQAQLAAEAARDAADDIVNLGDLAYKDTVGTDDVDAGSISLEKLETVAENAGKFMGYSASGVPSPVDIDTSAFLDTAVSNITSNGKKAIAHMCLPDYSSAITLSGIYNSSNKYTAPADGLFIYYCFPTSIGGVFLNGVEIAKCLGSSQGYGGSLPMTIPMRQGDRIYVSTAAYSPYGGSFVPFLAAV